jgi:hypothetical protein
VHRPELATKSAQQNPPLWLRYLVDVFVIWPHGTERLPNLLSHLNGFRCFFLKKKKASHPVRNGNIVREYDFFSGCSAHEEMDDSGFQNLQVTHLRWPISQLQF